MSELDDIKARAAERRDAHGWHGGHGSPCTCVPGEAEADLDRAIAIADRAEIAGYAFYGHDKDSLVVQLREARDVVLKLRDDWLRIAKLNPIRKEQVGQGPMDDVCRFCGGMAPYIPNAEVEHKDCVWALAQRRVADTESYEQYRQQA